MTIASATSLRYAVEKVRRDGVPVTVATFADGVTACRYARWREATTKRGQHCDVVWRVIDLDDPERGDLLSEDAS